LFSYLFCSSNLERGPLNGRGVFDSVRLEALVTDSWKLLRLRIHLLNDAFATRYTVLGRLRGRARYVEDEEGDCYANQSTRQSLH
jgi:hypothetical protein